MTVVKADAYGCGDIDCVRLFEKYKEDWYGVSNLKEALAIREEGYVKPILILGYTPENQVMQLVNHNITQTVVSFAHGKKLAEEAKKQNVVVEIQIKLDSGMSRIGLLCYEEYWEKGLEEARCILNNPSLHVTGIFTHMATLYEVDEVAQKFGVQQYDRFKTFIAQLESEGYHLGIRHCCNTAGIINMPEIAMDMVRMGVGLFGLVADRDKKRKVALRNPFSIKATVAFVKKINKGAYFSYCRKFQAQQDMVVATIPIGYADGYRTQLSNRGHIIVHGVLCPVLGQICMDQLMIDVSMVPLVEMGDEVVLLGSMGKCEIIPFDFGDIVGVDPTEIYCLMARRMPRVYIRNGKPQYFIEYARKEMDWENQG